MKPKARKRKRKGCFAAALKVRPRGFEPLTFGSGAEILIGRSCHFNQLTVVHCCLFRPIWGHLPPILPPALPPKFGIADRTLTEKPHASANTSITSLRMGWPPPWIRLRTFSVVTREKVASPQRSQMSAGMCSTSTRRPSIVKTSLTKSSREAVPPQTWH